MINFGLNTGPRFCWERNNRHLSQSFYKQKEITELKYSNFNQYITESYSVFSSESTNSICYTNYSCNSVSLGLEKIRCHSYATGYNSITKVDRSLI